MKIVTLSLGPLQTNCYLVYDPLSNEGVVIDPADEAEFIAEKIQTLKFKLKALIATHGHFDHVLAAGELQMIFNVPFLIHRKDLFLLKQMNQSASHWLGYPINKPLPINIKFLKENEEIKFGNFNLKVLETPGHTPGSICFVKKLVGGARRGAPKKAATSNVPATFDVTQCNEHYLGLASNRIYQFFDSSNVLFSGDTLFKSGIGRYDFSYSSKEKLDQSLQKIFKLPKETIIYPGHGKETKIKEEKCNSIG